MVTQTVANNPGGVHEGVLAHSFLAGRPVSSPAEKQRLERVLRAQAVKNSKGPFMTDQALNVLMEIALTPGLTQQELSKRTGLNLSSISRNVMSLGEWHRNGVEGLKLVEAVDDPNERRRKIQFLTKEGVKFVRLYLEALTGERSDFDAPSSREYLTKAYSSNIR